MPRGGARPGSGRKPGVRKADRRVQLSCSISQDVLRKLDELAEKRGKSRSQVIEMALDGWFDAPENRLLLSGGEAGVPWIEPTAIGVPENRVSEMMDAYMERFDALGDPERAFVAASLSHLQAVQDSRASLLKSPDAGICSESDFLAVVDFIGTYSRKPAYRLWRDGDWWLVSETDPHLNDFLLSDARRKKVEAPTSLPPDPLPLLPPDMDPTDPMPAFPPGAKWTRKE